MPTDDDRRLYDRDSLILRTPQAQHTKVTIEESLASPHGKAERCGHLSPAWGISPLSTLRESLLGRAEAPGITDTSQIGQLFDLAAARALPLAYAPAQRS